MESIDIAPTFLDLAGLAQNQPMTGRTLVPYLGPDGASAVNGLAYAIDYSRRIRTLHRRSETGFHHLLETQRGARRSTELFDLLADPRETAALDDDTVDDELREILKAFRLEPRAEGETLELGGELEERLKSLGYLQ